MAEQVFKELVTQVFKAGFPKDYVDVSDGYHDNVHVVVVSRKLDGLMEGEKLELLWDIAENGLDGDVMRISLLLGYSPDELK